MESTRSSDSALVYFNGIDPDTGDYAVPPAPLTELAKQIIRTPGGANIAASCDAGTRGIAALLGVDLGRLDQAGWGIVFHEDAPEPVRAALQPLIEHRRRQALDRFKVLEYRRGELVRDWHQRYGVWAGSANPDLVPCYLLLVGAPTEIPFEFQYLLGSEYAVGRLAFEQAEDYACYARSIVAYETTAEVDASREIVYWSPRHPGDAATALSNSLLIRPLAHGVEGASAALRQPVHAEVGYRQRVYQGRDATRGALLGVFDAERPPAVLFTASHGLVYRAGQPKQRAEQGGLLCQNWPGYGAVRTEHCLAAADVPESARVHGMVAVFFACCGAGTPDKDQFLLDFETPDHEPALAPHPFVAALPQRLLSHPGGAALGVIGHIDRAFGFSIKPPKATGAQIMPFRNSLGLMLSGMRVGLALMTQFGQRFAALSVQLLSSVSPTAPDAMKLDEVELVLRWLERNDAQNYVLLGDPAARIRTEVLQQ
jgi:hypothetical protein